jgi:hypothetical protein
MPEIVTVYTQADLQEIAEIWARSTNDLAVGDITWELAVHDGKAPRLIVTYSTLNGGRRGSVRIERLKPKHRCPKCGSTDVEVGCVVLRCLDCGWTRIGETPCDTCGEPSVGYCSAGGKGRYYCRKHRPEWDVIFEEFANALRKAHAH